MTRFEMDDQFWGHHKTKRALRAGAEAIQMWFAMRFYVALNNSGGLVPDEDIEYLDGAPSNARKWLGVLVGCGKPLPGGGRGSGLIDNVDGFWALHDYDDHGLSPEEVEHRKELSRERQRRWRQGRLPVNSRPPDSTPTNGVSNALRNASTDGVTDSSRNPLGDVPDPIRSEELRSKELGVGSKDLTGSARDASLPPPPPVNPPLRSRVETQNAGAQPGQEQALAPKVAHSEPPTPKPPSAVIVAPSLTRRMRATDDLLTCPIGELAQRCRSNQFDASMAGIGERPELQRVNQAWADAVGLKARPLGCYSDKNRTLIALLEAFETTSEVDLLRACEQASRDDWCTGKIAGKGDSPRKRDIGCLSQNVLRRLLDDCEERRPKFVNPKLAAILDEERRRMGGAK